MRKARRVAEPDRAKPSADRERDTQLHLSQFARLSQADGLQTERREGGEPAAKTRHHELPLARSGEDAASRSGQGSGKTDDERAEHIDQQGAPGETRSEQCKRAHGSERAHDAADHAPSETAV